jgi:hypothetical protein
MNKLKIKITDYMVIIAILVWGAAGFWFNLQDVSAAERKYATIYHENRQVAELSLAPGESYSYSFQFGDSEAYTAHVEIEDGRVRMLPLGEDICPNAICSHTGWIEYNYESIVCLPNRIMVVFSDLPGSDNEGIDGITF